MSPVISSKRVFKPTVMALASLNLPAQFEHFWAQMADDVLAQKVKFPLLAYLAHELFDTYGRLGTWQIIEGLKGRPEAGSSVVAGVLLQCLLPTDLDIALEKGKALIVAGDCWYHCDHLGERVHGHALLTQFGSTLPFIREYTTDPNQWVRRSVGVAAHYATKKGLEAEAVDTLLRLLLRRANSADYQEQRGIGWGLKTIGKFHPQLLRAALALDPPIVIPIRRKIEAGLGAAASRSQ